MAKKMTSKGKTAQPSTSAPRGSSWRAGVPSTGAGVKTGYNGNKGAKSSQVAVHGASTANMGDATPVNGRNIPRGMFQPANVQRSIVAEGSSPLTRRGRK